MRVTDVYTHMTGAKYQMRCKIDGALYISLPRCTPNGAISDIAVQYMEKIGVPDAPVELWSLFKLAYNE